MMAKADLEFQKRISKFIPPKDNWTPIDKALFTPKIFFEDYQKTAGLTFNAIKYSFDHHFENNALYRRLCEVNKVSPSTIKSKDDLNKIPLLPDSFFKDYPEGKGFLNWLDNVYTGSTPMPTFRTETPDHDNVIEEFNKKGVSIMFTSGTSGRFSFIPRDDGSWDRLKYNAMKSVVELMDYNPNDTVILLIPDARQTNLTIASLFGIAYDLYDPKNIHVALEDTKVTTQLLRMQRNQAIGIKEKIKAKAISKLSPIVHKKSDYRIINLLESLEKEGKRANIAGPPFWLNRILKE